MFSKCSELLARQLHMAVDGGNVKRIEGLLGRGANPNHQLYWTEEWRWKFPPLHLACEKGNLEIVKMLVHVGADIDKGDLTVL